MAKAHVQPQERSYEPFSDSMGTLYLAGGPAKKNRKEGDQGGRKKIPSTMFTYTHFTTVRQRQGGEEKSQRQIVTSSCI